MALITLGAQLSQIEIKTLINKTIVVSCFTRLVIGPVAVLSLFIYFKLMELLHNHYLLQVVSQLLVIAQV